MTRVSHVINVFRSQAKEKWVAAERYPAEVMLPGCGDSEVKTSIIKPAFHINWSGKDEGMGKHVDKVQAFQKRKPKGPVGSKSSNNKMKMEEKGKQWDAPFRESWDSLATASPLDTD